MRISLYYSDGDLGYLRFKRDFLSDTDLSIFYSQMEQILDTPLDPGGLSELRNGQNGLQEVDVSKLDPKNFKDFCYVDSPKKGLIIKMLSKFYQYNPDNRYIFFFCTIFEAFIRGKNLTESNLFAFSGLVNHILIVNK